MMPLGRQNRNGHVTASAKALNARERSFVTAYRGKAAGNGARAAVLAGYARGSAKVTASRLLTRANVQAELRTRILASERLEKADADERDRILTGFARDAKTHKDVRISAIKELNKVDGRHTMRHQIEGKVTIEHALTASWPKE